MIPPILATVEQAPTPLFLKQQKQFITIQRHGSAHAQAVTWAYSFFLLVVQQSQVIISVKCRMQVELLMPKFHGRCEPIGIRNVQFSISIQFYIRTEGFFLDTLTSDLLESYWFINNRTDWCTRGGACRRNSSGKYHLHCCRNNAPVLYSSPVRALWRWWWWW